MTNNEQKAYDILDLVDNLLEEKGISVPCEDPREEAERQPDINDARIYGMEYARLHDGIVRVLDAK